MKSVASGADPDAIKDEITALEATCGFYVERRMNEGIKDAMAGHNIDEFNQG